jgi:hypothetical protein
VKKPALSKPLPGQDHPGAPSEYRGVPSKSEEHSHGHKLAAVPVTPTKKKSAY